MRKNRYTWWLAVLLLAFAPALANAQTAQLAAAKDEARKVVKSVCGDCHESQAAGIAGTLHGKQAIPGTPAAAAAQECESCHGPGGKHLEDPEANKPLQLDKLKGAKASEVCTSCHASGEHALWSGSKHDARGVACTTCHSVHHAKGEGQLKAENEIQMCASCHQNVVTKVNRHNHMPVREGQMTCSSCHNPHGSANSKLLNAGTTTQEACVSCHTEKRGPVLWEHAPVANDCSTCHDPHGSNNDRMLVAKAPFLCQRCHVTSRHPPTIYNGVTINTTQNANKITGRNCMNCHTQIHGSNSPNGKALLR